MDGPEEGREQGGLERLGADSLGERHDGDKTEQEEIENRGGCHVDSDIYDVVASHTQAAGEIVQGKRDVGQGAGAMAAFEGRPVKSSEGEPIHVDVTVLHDVGHVVQVERSVEGVRIDRDHDRRDRDQCKQVTAPGNVEICRRGHYHTLVRPINE